MSIRSKVVGCFLVILAGFIGVSAFNYARFHQANNRLHLVNEIFLPFSRVLVQLQGNIYSAAEEMHRVFFQPELETESGASNRMVRDLYPYLINKRFSTLEHILSKDDNEPLRGTIADLSAMLTRVRELFAKLDSSKDRAQFESTYVELRTELQSISRRVDNECQTITLAAQNEGRDSLVSGIFLCSGVVLFGIMILFLSSRVLRPLPLLIDSVKKIADGDFNQSLKVNSSDQGEVAILAREYNRMLTGLVERDRKIQAQQTELLQSERLAAVGQLSAEVVHEIRNPLNSISLNIDWLQTEIANANEEVTKTLQSISREIERLHQITESYLVRARVPVEEPERTGVNDLIKEIIAFSREEDRGRNIKVQTILSPTEIYVKAARSRLKQAFLNVIKNAREAMPRGGTLIVRSEIKDNVYRIQFSDSGYGMNDATRQKTFNPFYTTKPNGTGLGLALTKTIVEESQGSIHCESLMGRGTTFTVQFPV